MCLVLAFPLPGYFEVFGVNERKALSINTDAWLGGVQVEILSVQNTLEMIRVGVKVMAQGNVLAAQAWRLQFSFPHKCIKIQVCMVAHVQRQHREGRRKESMVEMVSFEISERLQYIR